MLVYHGKISLSLNSVHLVKVTSNHPEYPVKKHVCVVIRQDGFEPQVELGNVGIIRNSVRRTTRAEHSSMLSHSLIV